MVELELCAKIISRHLHSVTLEKSTAMNETMELAIGNIDSGCQTADQILTEEERGKPWICENTLALLRLLLATIWIVLNCQSIFSTKHRRLRLGEA